MPTYNITNQAVAALDTRLTEVKATLETRRALWAALSPAKREAWKANCPDPILAKMWALYVWLKAFFGEA